MFITIKVEISMRYVTAYQEEMLTKVITVREMIDLCHLYALESLLTNI